MYALYECVYRWIDEWIDLCVVWIYSMDGWIDGWTDICIACMMDILYGWMK